MLLHALALTACLFIISYLAMVLAGARLRRSSRWLSVGWLAVVLGLGNLIATDIFGPSPSFLMVTALATTVGIVTIAWRPVWNALGQIAWTGSLLITLVFVGYAYSFATTAAGSTLFFVAALVAATVQSVALLLLLTHTYENIERLCRLSWPKRIEEVTPIPGYAPFVSLHVPAYDEPPALVEGTLRALAALDYPNYEVLVIDNNTPDDDAWRPLAQLCRELGPRFRFLHLSNWPGFKSGALNFGLAQTAPQAELIAIIDADYQVEPHFLSETVSLFADETVGFIQLPQDYRAFSGNSYLEALHASYKVFFDISMEVRNEYNAIIFGGTMGIIRKSALQMIGGWDEWCITEDAEASLRILNLGYQGYFYNRTLGRGIMPLTFQDLKKQRFRWCFGGMQILRKHWEALMPWSKRIDPNNQLSLAQQIFYLIGGFQWLTDLFNLLGTVMLIFIGLLAITAPALPIGPWNSPLIVMPVMFLVMNLWRFVSVLRFALGLSWSLALRALYMLFSLSWVVALAAFKGIVQTNGVFLRTPKIKNEAKLLEALRISRWEATLGTTALLTGGLALAETPSAYTVSLALFLTWQASVYLAAPIYSWFSIR